MAKKSTRKIIEQMEWKIPIICKMLPDDDTSHQAEEVIEWNGKDVLLNGIPLIEYPRKKVLNVTGFLTKKYKQLEKQKK